MYKWSWSVIVHQAEWGLTYQTQIEKATGSQYVVDILRVQSWLLVDLSHWPEVAHLLISRQLRTGKEVLYRESETL